MSFNLASILEEVAASDPEGVLVHVGHDTFTYGQVDARARRVAAGLLARGLIPGDRVMVQLPNVPEFLDAYFGILKAGLVMVPVNPLLSAPEIVFQLADSQAKMLITSAAVVAAAADASERAGGVDLVVVGPASGAAVPFASLAGAAPLVSSHATNADDTAVILYTSGTTGRPKGAELTHFELFMNCTVAGELFQVGRDDLMTGVLPFFHVFGLSSVLNIAVRYGAGLVLFSRFEPAAILDGVERHRITIFSGVPTMYVALLQESIGTRDLSSLRIGVSGGASMPEEVIRAFEQKYAGVVILEGYGLSETASVATFNVDARQRKVGSIGRPVWGVQMRVVDSEDREMGPGADQVGEILIRGHNVMKGYRNLPEATAEAMRGGWFHTGDLGYRDEDGYYFVADRLKDLIIRGGYNVYPREVEEVLYGHPDVLEAAVVGKPNDRLGEEIVAYVALRPGGAASVEDLDAHCRASLAAYKYPREFRLIPSLPKGATGKVLKRELRASPTPTRIADPSS